MKKLLSLFSGCGGMDIGFEGDFICLRKEVNEKIHPDWIKKEDGEWIRVSPTIFDTVFANDIRPDAKAAWVSYFGKKKSNANDIYHLDSVVDLVKCAKKGEKVFPEDIDVVTGGFPCQDFSVAGKRKGFNSQKSHLGGKMEADEPSVESRGQLYMWMREVITLTSPKVFIAENVKGLTNLSDVKEVIERDFANAGNGGYLVVPAKVLYAPDYGFVNYPEIFMGDYNRYTLWLTLQQSVINPHVRDCFTAGGVKPVTLLNGEVKDFPAIYNKLNIHFDAVAQRLCQANPAELECDVEVDDKEQKRQFRQWAERVSGNAILHPKSCVSYEESLEALDMMSIKHGFGDFLS